MEISNTKDVYSAIEEVIARLRKEGATDLADTLHHRLHSVSWTTSSELLEELQSVLNTALQSPPLRISSTLQQLMKDTLAVINRNLT